MIASRNFKVPSPFFQVVTLCGKEGISLITVDGVFTAQLKDLKQVKWIGEALAFSRIYTVDLLNQLRFNWVLLGRFF